MLVIFSAYATWNNIVFYAKEGYTKPASAAPSEAELPALKEERDILKRQLKNAQDLIDSLRQAVGLPGGPRPAKSHSLLDTLVGFLLPLRAHDAYAQEPPRSPGAARSSERPSVQQLRDKLRQYELQQQQLNEKLEGVKREEKTREAPQQRLIKNW